MSGVHDICLDQDVFSQKINGVRGVGQNPPNSGGSVNYHVRFGIGNSVKCGLSVTKINFAGSPPENLTGTAPFEFANQRRADKATVTSNINLQVRPVDFTIHTLESATIISVAFSGSGQSVQTCAPVYSAPFCLRAIFESGCTEERSGQWWVKDLLQW